MPDSNNVIVKYSDFFQDDGGMKKTKEDFFRLSDDLIAKAKEVRKETRIVSLKDNKGIDELITKTSQLTEVRRKYNATLRKIDALNKKLNAQRGKTKKAITAETEAIKKQNKERRLAATIQNTTTGSIENMRAKLSLVTIAWTKLTGAETTNTKRGRRLTESKKQLTAQLLKLEKATGDSRRQVGAYEKGLGRLRGGFIRLAQAAGLTLGIFGAFRLIKSSISIVRDFEKQNATLAGVLQKTKGNISELVEDSKRLGAITVKTAGQVAGLQTEYARLGFSQAQILKLTEPTIQGSIAMNSELSATAQLVGAVVNSYDDLSASDAPAIIDTMALATAKSALNFEKLNVGLPIVLGAANALNVPLTEVTATLGKLADAGIETSTGATSLRNIFIEAAKRGLNYKDALKQISKSTDKLSTANKLFGKRAAVSALVIANNTEAVGELDEALQDAAGTAQSMADKELDTLDGSIKLLTSAWEGLILQLNDATDGGNVLSNTIRFLAENLQTIFKVIGIATTSYLAYVIAVKAANLATKLGIVWTRGASIATNIKTAATTAATAAQKAFNTTLKANPLGLIVALLAAAVTAYYAFRDSVSAAEKAQKLFNETKQESFEVETEKIGEEKKVQNKRVQELEHEINVRRANGEKSAKLDKELIERKKKILTEEIAVNQKIIDSQNEVLDNNNRIVEERLANSKKVQDDLKQRAIDESYGTQPKAFGRNVTGPVIKQINANDRVIKETEAQKAGIVGIIQARNKEIASLAKDLDAIDKKLTVQIAENGKKRKKVIQARIKELALLRRRLEDLQDGSIKNDENRELQQNKRKFDREIKAIKGNSKIEIELRKELEREKQRQIVKIRGKFTKERLALLKRGQEIERFLITDKDDKAISIETAKTKKLIAEITKNTELVLAKRKELILKAELSLQKFKDDIAHRSDLRDLENAKLIAEAKIEQRRGEFKTQKEYEVFKNAEFIKIQRKYLTERLALIQSFGGDDYKVEIEQLKAQLANLDVDPPEIDKWKKFADEMKAVLTQVSIEIEKALQKSVEKSQKALSEQQKAVDTQRARAEKGLTNTLAFEQKEQAKREAELIKRQKRLDRIQKLKSYWNTYNANLSSLKEGEDSSRAITKTLRDIAIIEALTASLSSFGDGGIVGVDGVKTNSFGITRGRSHNKGGGVLAFHEGGEGFLSRNEIDNIGMENFYKFKQMAATGPLDQNFFSGQGQSFSASLKDVVFTDPRLVKGMVDVKDAILSRPSQSLNVPEVVDGILRFTETISKGNLTKRNHYVVKKPRL